ncbi:hypothetical protein HAX54_004268 [Datura stramonium]|uniref:Uncharacterized protein n=1 Tax=Datura stramonium TaxID=4076 RepID=A0ABS8T7Y2_DATST|nr:hypothetical protein [Datura stramonium]
MVNTNLMNQQLPIESQFISKLIDRRMRNLSLGKHLMKKKLQGATILEELEIEFLSKFEPLEFLPDQKVDKLKGDLARVTAIRRDLAGVEKDDAASKSINEFMENYAASDRTRTDDHHHISGSGYTSLDAGSAGGASDRYTPAVEEA